MKYASWNQAKEKEEGFSKELISTHFDLYRGSTTLDELECWLDKNLNTVYKGFCKNYREIPDHPLLGTKVGDAYQWSTFRECFEITKDFASGC